ncbi:gas vesicle protein GvpJ [Plantactinospora siamensis]|uniref:gas vesicle protein GvpJ n=1 Tax=Plantactinospora siamensis TaxID=555372 RepID=UPI00406BA708
MTGPRQPSVVQNSGQVLPAGHEPANLGDILERVLDRGIVIAGDIRVSLLDIELLTVKLRLIIASVDTAREMGIDWWQHDPFLSSRPRRPVERDRRRGELTDDGNRYADQRADDRDRYDSERYHGDRREA